MDWDDTLAIVRVIHEAVAFFGYNHLSASRWFSSPVIGLGGQHPKDLVQSKAGRQAFLTLLEKLAHGVPP
ncbi:antitoxin Xre/MbcA/ParS toxin-binding domain-containing protein [Pseudomonas sp. LFM046]|uniref:antitoxin Xre/MbcA/ParS toxin-binding domain-containing protein n=1 Tax=Pseudomonas sp. LFM046 TaxID=1608357 RepID=UPI0005CF9F49|nr:antitoxin Xre/MbcA/ParS toxin-binding domain-containing protein [Pseudomonas sp. LFM046]